MAPRPAAAISVFNGAAPARARNDASSPLPELPPFNGAAPARARNVFRSLECSFIWEPASTGPRPRGRGMAPSCRPKPAYVRFNGAAPARARNVEDFTPRTPCENCASTGPRPRGRGMNSNCIGCATVRNVLQRGRARAGAECSPTRTLVVGVSLSFNGAAPARARNVSLRFGAGLFARVLQRGRARAGAE